MSFLVIKLIFPFKFSNWKIGKQTKNHVSITTISIYVQTSQKKKSAKSNGCTQSVLSNFFFLKKLFNFIEKMNTKELGTKCEHFEYNKYYLCKTLHVDMWRKRKKKKAQINQQKRKEKKRW